MDENENSAEFFIVLCNDVLLEALQYGSRCQIIKLEHIGRQLLRINATHLSEKPFLRLNIQLHGFSFQYVFINVIFTPFIGMNWKQKSVALFLNGYLRINWLMFLDFSALIELIYSAILVGGQLLEADKYF